MTDDPEDKLKSVYAAPLHDVPHDETEAAARLRRASYVMFAIAIVVTAGAVGAGAFLDIVLAQRLGCFASMGVSLSGGVFAIRAIREGRRAKAPPSLPETMGAIGSVLGNLVMVGVSAFAAYLAAP